MFVTAGVVVSVPSELPPVLAEDAAAGVVVGSSELLAALEED